jgi:hypothetical protein
MSAINLNSLELCKGCGLSEATHSHHVVPLVLGGLDQPSNIIDLCNDCHGKIHDIDYTSHVALIRAGIARAKASGVKLGKPALPKSKLKDLERLRAMGLSFKTISKITGVSVGKVWSHLKK